MTYCEKYGYPQPHWQEIGSTMRVTFYPHPEIQRREASIKKDNVPVNVLVSVPVKLPLNERQSWFWEELAQGKILRAPDLARKWGVAVLQKHKLIDFVGSAKIGTYALLSKGSR